jgi:hypothetical protein
MTRNVRSGGGHLKQLLLLLVILSPVLYLSTCTYISRERVRAFDSIRIGDTRALVLKQFGNPSVYEKEGEPYLRYSSVACSTPCVERLWYENFMTFGIEAWSVEVGWDNKVVHKAHWVSP